MPDVWALPLRPFARQRFAELRRSSGGLLDLFKTRQGFLLADRPERDERRHELQLLAQEVAGCRRCAELVATLLTAKTIAGTPVPAEAAYTILLRDVGSSLTLKDVKTPARFSTAAPWCARARIDSPGLGFVPDVRGSRSPSD